jgi:hypothetical protein
MHPWTMSGTSPRWNLTAVEEKWRGNGGEPLVEGELQTREHAIEGEVSVVMAEGCSSSFYSGRGRAHRGGGGGNGRR